MFHPLLPNPSPDFAGFVRILEGKVKPWRVPLVEIGIDDEVLQAIQERYMGRPWVAREKPPQPAYLLQCIELYNRLGYDYVPMGPIWLHHPEPLQRLAPDTAGLSRGQREWVEEGRGLIASWKDYEAFPWDQITADLSLHHFVAAHLPEGMKMTVGTTLFERALEQLLGYEGLFYLLHDEPGLVAQVFDRWGRIVYDYYVSVIGLHAVGAIFHTDDLGYKTSTLVSPNVLRRLFFPWLEKYAALAHAHGKPFYYHCCGNVYAAGVIEDLVTDVGIDAFHAFQDEIMPIGVFKARYGSRVAALGGLDMDHLARMDQATLRQYVRRILQECMPGGRFAIGSGNTVANYIPIENYFVVLEEGRRWEG